MDSFVTQRLVLPINRDSLIRMEGCHTSFQDLIDLDFEDLNKFYEAEAEEKKEEEKND